MEAITQAASAAASTVAKAAAKTLRAVAPVVEPEGKVPSTKQLELFFENRALRPEFFTFDPKGNLIVREELAGAGKGKYDTVPGAVKKVYTIPPYRPITKEEREEATAKRIDAVRAIEDEYDTAITELRQLYNDYKEGDEVTIEEILKANEKVEGLDATRHAAMYPVREVYGLTGLPVKLVFREDVFDKEKSFGEQELTFIRRSTQRLRKLYVTEGEEVIPEPPVREEAGAAAAAPATESKVQGGGAAGKDTFAQQLAKDLKIILFGQPEENEYGFLSTFYPVEFVLNGIKYFTIEQVLAAEKARLFLEDDLRQRIMKTRAPRSMRTMANNIVRKTAQQTGGMRAIDLHEWQGNVRKDLLRQATLAKFKQHADLKDRLVATGDATLVLADSREKSDGIGIALTDPLAANPAAWKGGNLYGSVLMDVRKQLREEDRGDEVVTGGAGTEAVKESVISSDGYHEKLERARKIAIMNRVRGRVGFN
jgi:ribA/ribD-fused uncharacterized protein